MEEKAPPAISHATIASQLTEGPVPLLPRPYIFTEFKKNAPVPCDPHASTTRG